MSHSFSTKNCNSLDIGLCTFRLPFLYLLDKFEVMLWDFYQKVFVLRRRATEVAVID